MDFVTAVPSMEYYYVSKKEKDNRKSFFLSSAGGCLAWESIGVFCNTKEQVNEIQEEENNWDIEEEYTEKDKEKIQGYQGRK